MIDSSYQISLEQVKDVLLQKAALENGGGSAHVLGLFSTENCVCLPYRVGTGEPLEELSAVFNRFNGRIMMLRHGPTDLSEQNKIAGGVPRAALRNRSLLENARENVPLSEKGERDTERLANSDVGRLLRDFARTALVVVSPLKRCQTTAEIVLRSGDFKTCDGLNEQYLAKDFSSDSEEGRRKLNSFSYTPPGSGEGSAVFIPRVVDTVGQILGQAQKENRDVLIIGHSNWILSAAAVLGQLTDSCDIGPEMGGGIRSGEPVVVGRLHPKTGRRRIFKVTEQNVEASRRSLNL